MSFLRKKAFASRVQSAAPSKQRGRPVKSDKERADAAEIIANETDYGRDIIRFMVGVMNNQMDEMTPAARVAAATWLGSYLWGKAVDRTVQLNMTSSVEVLPNMTDDQLEELLRGGIPQGLLGGDTQIDAGDVGRPAELVATVDGDVGVSEVLPEILQSRPVEGGAGADDVPEVDDEPGDGDAPPDDDDGPVSGGEV